MKHSIKSKLTVVVVGLIAGSIIACIILNLVFLNRYYTAGKIEDLNRVHETTKAVFRNDAIISEDEKLLLTGTCDRYGVSLLVADASSEKVYTYGDPTNIMSKRLTDSMIAYGQSGVDGYIVEKGDDYTIIQYYDSEVKVNYYELYSVLENDNIVFMRMALENVNSLATRTNGFFAIMGCIVILISVIVVSIVSYSFTHKLLKLVEISKRMSNMDFGVRYVVHDWFDEVDDLGENINKMADRLEKNIRELKTANLELEKDIQHKTQIEEMRTEFVSNVSHELKTPLAIIQGYAEGLKEGINDDPESREFYCDVIIDEAAKMNKMVKQLLTLNQIENGKEPLDIERFNITEVIRQRIQAVALILEQNDIKIRFENTEEIYVWADEYKIEEVITNYISNAINHIKYDKIIEIKLQKNNEGIVRVTVFNTGDNIPEEDIDNIWDKFYKVDKARTREYGGSGIGLSIVKAIMNSHGRRFGVENRDNGVEFWFETDGNINSCNLSQKMV